MKLAVLKTLLESAAITGFEFPDPPMRVEVEDFYEEVPSEYHNTEDLEFSQHDGHTMVKVIIIPPSGQKLTESMTRVINERIRQREVKGFDLKRDKKQYYSNQELALAAAAYAIPDGGELPPPKRVNREGMFPWKEHWKPSPDNRLRELEKAGALILAQMDVILDTER